MKRTEAGFTLIELVIVIVILGILAATAIPRFVNLQTDARIATVRGMEGALRGAAALAHATQLAQSKASGTAVTMEGASVAMTFGYPTTAAAGIANALSDYSGFTYAPAGGEFQVSGIANCLADYTAPAAANNPPVIALTTSGC